MKGKKYIFNVSLTKREINTMLWCLKGMRGFTGLGGDGSEKTIDLESSIFSIEQSIKERRCRL